MGQSRRRLYTGNLYVQSMREGRAGNSSALLYNPFISDRKTYIVIIDAIY